MSVLTNDCLPAAAGEGFAIIDLETTGLSPRSCRIVEIAVVLLDSDCRVVGEMVTLVNPGQHVGATDVHGIRARDLVDAPSFADLAPLMLAGLDGRVPVAHNVMFDIRFLAAEFERLGLGFDDTALSLLCTMHLAPSYLPSLPARSLAACAAAAGIPQTVAHSALDDARVTAQLLAYYRATHDDLPPSWRDALGWAATYQWPGPLDDAGCRLVTRQEVAYRAATEKPYLARLVSRLPRTGGDSQPVEAYLALLDRALEDRLVTAQEAQQLGELAEALGLSADTVHGAHGSYLQALAGAALADGVITDAEHADLEEATHLLGLGDDDLRAALAEAARAPSPVGAPCPEGALCEGDRVVITGDTLIVARKELERRTVAAGLRLVSAVSGKTNVLVIADPHSQSTKARRARELGIRIIGEAAYLNMLESVQPARA